MTEVDVEWERDLQHAYAPISHTKGVKLEGKGGGDYT